MTRTREPNPNCPRCGGAGHYYWDAPVYHNERQRERAECNCWRPVVQPLVTCGRPPFPLAVDR